MILCGHKIDATTSLFAIAGPCVIESEELTLGIAEALAATARRLGLLLIFKASFDKANRSSDKSFQVAAAAQAVDVLQTPAFLARQTDFIAAVAASGKPVNIKKAQFMAPADMRQVVAKARNAAQAAGHEPDAFLLCERGTSFGYNTLVSDMRSLSIMAETGCPVVFDATHSVQQPGGLGERSGGQREYVPLLARAAVAAGVAGVFMETHPDPNQALSDGPNALPLDQFEPLWKRLMAIDAVVKG